MSRSNKTRTIREKYEYIGAGTYGVAVRPAWGLDGVPQNILPEKPINTIGKIMEDEEEAEIELAALNIIKSFDPAHTVTPRHLPWLMKVDSKDVIAWLNRVLQGEKTRSVIDKIRERDVLHQIVLEYVGDDLTMIRTRRSISLCDAVKYFVPISRWIMGQQCDPRRSQMIVHSDIKCPNMTRSGDKTHLIDWGLAFDPTCLTSNIMNRMYSEYSVWPPEHRAYSLLFSRSKDYMPGIVTGNETERRKKKIIETDREKKAAFIEHANVNFEQRYRDRAMATAAEKGFKSTLNWIYNTFLLYRRDPGNPLSQFLCDPRNDCKDLNDLDKYLIRERGLEKYIVNCPIISKFDVYSLGIALQEFTDLERIDPVTGTVPSTDDAKYLRYIIHRMIDPDVRTRVGPRGAYFYLEDFLEKYCKTANQHMLPILKRPIRNVAAPRTYAERRR